MNKPGLLSLFAAGALFAAFFSNVAFGALGYKPMLNDVQEMLMLFASSVLFAVAVLRMEAAHLRNNS